MILDGYQDHRDVAVEIALYDDKLIMIMSFAIDVKSLPVPCYCEDNQGLAVV